MSKYIRLDEATDLFRGIDATMTGSFVADTLESLPTIEVSEDCISREQVRAKLDYISYAEKDPISIAKRIVDDAPSVLPSRAEGEWLLSELQSQVDNDNGNYVYVCTNCNHTDIHAKTQKVPYCWWCGARMKGAEE